MKLGLFREMPGDDSCAGSIYIDGDFQWHSLEDELREVKVPGETAITIHESFRRRRMFGAALSAH